MPSLPGGRLDMSYSEQKLILMAIMAIAWLAHQLVVKSNA